VKCRNCGAELPIGAMFCGECGASLVVPKLVQPVTRPRPGDTVTITPVASRAPRPTPPRPMPPRPVEEIEHVAGPEPEEHDVVEHVAGPEPEELAPEPDPAPAPEPASSAPRSVAPRPAPPHAPVPSAASVPPAASVPLPMPPQPVGQPRVASGPPMPAPPALGDSRGDGTIDDDHVDLEETRIVRGMRAGERFVLQFSTGENSIVFGSGLIGRNPALEPGEFVDQLIAIVDGGKTVSKTHLEFGQVEGQFWVSDRFSANGTIVRQPDTRPQRLEPGRRQQVARGTRIDMGEQFVVVS
jgi:hypothetical protein